uniref:Uncharacterized protein n=1 Tax=Ascaris lumbricoides TaxID=6252 RepID=A0A0M3HJ61_ASCLU
MKYFSKSTNVFYSNNRFSFHLKFLFFIYFIVDKNILNGSITFSLSFLFLSTFNLISSRLIRTQIKMLEYDGELIERLTCKSSTREFSQHKRVAIRVRCSNSASIFTNNLIE